MNNHKQQMIFSDKGESTNVLCFPGNKLITQLQQENV